MCDLYEYDISWNIAIFLRDKWFELTRGCKEGAKEGQRVSHAASDYEKGKQETTVENKEETDAFQKSTC